MGDIVAAADLTWEEVVERSKMPVLAIFHTPSCTYCQEIMPYFEEYARKFQGRGKFVRINTLESSFIPDRYGVMATPTFKLFCGGRPIQEMVGTVQPFLLKRMVEGGYIHRCRGEEAINAHRLQHRLPLRGPPGLAPLLHRPSITYLSFFPTICSGKGDSPQLMIINNIRCC